MAHHTQVRTDLPSPCTDSPSLLVALQFAAPGWTYVAGSGQGSLPDGTQYTTRLNTHTPANLLEFSITMLTSGGAAASADFVIGGLTAQSLPTSLHVWQTTEDAPFVQMQDIAVNSTDGSFSVPLVPNAMISVTTTTGQGRPAPLNPIPPSAPFPFPYADDFQSYPEGAYAKYFCDEGGVWVVQVRMNATPCEPPLTPLDFRTFLLSAAPPPGGRQWRLCSHQHHHAGANCLGDEPHSDDHGAWRVRPTPLR